MIFSSSDEMKLEFDENIRKENFCFNNWRLHLFSNIATDKKYIYISNDKNRRATDCIKSLERIVQT